MEIRLKHLRRNYGSLHAVDDVSLHIPSNTVFGIIGRSGAGKSTLVRLISMLERPDEGEVYYDEKRVDNLDKKELILARRRIGMIFQNFNLFRNKTALENVTEGLIVVRKMDKKEAIARAEATLEKVGMLSFASHYPSELSGGQQQRVAIARAIAADPEIVYFDEPTSALDPELAKEVLSVMRMLAEEGMTMVVVTHAMDFARNVSKHVVFMEHGVVVESGETGSFFSAPKLERTREFLNMEGVK